MAVVQMIGQARMTPSARRIAAFPPLPRAPR